MRDEARSHDLNGELVRCYNCQEFGHLAAHCVKRHGRSHLLSKTLRKELESKQPKAEYGKNGIPLLEEVIVKKENWFKDKVCYACRNFGHYASHCPMVGLAQ